jgi:hypothetical protein
MMRYHSTSVISSVGMRVDAGRAHENVDAAELAQTSIVQRREHCEAADVARLAQRPPPHA